MIIWKDQGFFLSLSLSSRLALSLTHSLSLPLFIFSRVGTRYYRTARAQSATKKGRERGGRPAVSPRVYNDDDARVRARVSVHFGEKPRGE